MPLVGGLIGFFTNWLAIKMIFRPHNSKKFFGIRIPFTPGLIPKERYNISKKIGGTVSKHILTDEVILSAIQEKDFTPMANKIYNDFIFSVQKNKSLKDLFEENTALEINSILDKEIDYFLEKLNSPVVKEKIVCEINSFFFLVLEDKETKEKLLNLLNEYFKNLEFKNVKFLEKFYNDERSIKEAVKEENLDKFKEVIFNNIDPIILLLTSSLEDTNSEANKILSNITEKLIVAGAGKMASIFLNPLKIYDSIREKFIFYINNDRDDLIEKINLLIDEIVSKEMKEVPNYFSDENIENFIKRIYFDLKEKFVEDFVEESSLKDQLVKLYPDLSIRSKELIYKAFNSFLEKEYNKLKILLKDQILTWFWNINLLDIEEKLKIFPQDKVIKFIEINLRNAIEKNGKDIVEQLELDKIVENKINTMEIVEIENIILDVANKELKMITYLGGIIGAIIGLIPLIVK